MTPPAGPRGDLAGDARFVPGYVLAGRYRMIARLGRGGMGEVWRADDLVLDSPVALKLIYSTDPDGRARILNEVRLARQITHPAVCRVFDVGEGEGEIFYSMELIRGEDLATLVRRLGRLPREKVVEIGQQLCSGLAAAHAQGVLHRDLKPANILIDENGLVKITDFGIAVGPAGHRVDAPLGTAGYMAPEQLESGAAISEQTDLYALGLVLYELVAGRPAFESQAAVGKVQPPKPSSLIRDVDPHLERAILKAISRNPRERPASALALSELLTAPDRRLRRRRIAVAVLVAGGLAAAGIASSFFFTSTTRALTNQDTILLADFQNTTGEPVFDGALKVALAVALEQSPFLKVFPDERVRETLQLMERAPDEPVTRTVAREIARREGLKALVAGSISRLGSHYVLAVQAVDAASGDVMAREQVEVQAKESVLTSLGEATARLREKLGESLALIKRFDVPLAQATTSSLEALHAYSLALDEGRVVPRSEALPHLKRAIELDPEFAMAQALISGVYANTGRSGEAPAFSRRAFELRDRVSERERFFISWRYYVDAEQAWSKALELSTSWTATYPREAFAFNSLGMASAAFGQHDRAVAAFREAIRLDPRFVPPYGNLAGSLIALNRFDEAADLVRQAAAHGVDATAVRRMNYMLAFLQNDAAGMARELALVRASPQAMWGAVWEARAASFAGDGKAAHELFNQAADIGLRGGLRELGAQWTIEDAEVHAIGGQCADTRREVAAGLSLNRDNFTLERAARSLAWCGDQDEAMRLSSELGSRFPEATLTTRIQRPVIAAAAAVRGKEFARALEILQPVRPYDFAPAAELWPVFLRGEAYLGMNDLPMAAAEFQRILDRRGAAPTSPLYSLARTRLARASGVAADAARSR